MNGDGKNTIEDATLIQKAIADITTLDNNQRVFADVNGDGIVSVFDVTLIQKYIVGGYSNTGNVGKPAII
ncbi:MAG: dockerin type I repeat-containing protein [Ruminococcus bromii]|nr:dockerin type I repeat-containing protein [Ruminococcus bromii]MDY4711728.1 dockerin type I repeat-containing protein [Ruminococcus bromii]